MMYDKTVERKLYRNESDRSKNQILVETLDLTLLIPDNAIFYYLKSTIRKLYFKNRSFSTLSGLRLYRFVVTLLAILNYRSEAIDAIGAGRYLRASTAR